MYVNCFSIKLRKIESEVWYYIEFTLSTFVFFFFKDFIYLSMRDREREGEREAEREVGSMQGARCGTRSRVSRIAPWAKGRRQTAAPPRDPYLFIFKDFIYLS